MFGKLEEFKQPELTLEEKAFTAGYNAAEKYWLDYIVKNVHIFAERPGVMDEIRDALYDTYIAAMYEYFSKKDAPIYSVRTLHVS